MKPNRQTPGTVRVRGRIRLRVATLEDFLHSGALGFVATFDAIERRRNVTNRRDGRS